MLLYLSVQCCWVLNRAQQYKAGKFVDEVCLIKIYQKRRFASAWARYIILPFYYSAHTFTLRLGSEIVHSKNKSMKKENQDSEDFDPILEEKLKPFQNVNPFEKMSPELQDAKKDLQDYVDKKLSKPS